MGPEYTSVAIQEGGASEKWTQERITASDKCLFVVEGYVVDATKFIYEHPGGARALKKAKGKDSTASFLRVGHSSYARGLLKKMGVGVFSPTSIPSTPSTPTRPTKLPPLKITPLGATIDDTDCTIVHNDNDNDTNDRNDRNDRNDTRPATSSGEGLLSRTKVTLDAIRVAELEAEAYAVEWHAQRRRDIIEAHPEVVKEFGPSCLALPVGIVMCALHAFTCIVVQALPVWCVFVAAYTIGAVCKMYQFMVGHELTHGLVGKWANFPLSKMLLMGLVNVPGVGSYLHVYVSTMHLGHHRALGSDMTVGSAEKTDGDVVTLNHLLQLIQLRAPCLKHNALFRILTQSIGVVLYMFVTFIVEGMYVLLALVILPFALTFLIVSYSFKACGGKLDLSKLLFGNNSAEDKEGDLANPASAMGGYYALVGLVYHFALWVSITYFLVTLPSTHLAHHLPPLAEAHMSLVLPEFRPLHGLLYFLMSESFFQGFLMHPFGAYFLTVHRSSNLGGKVSHACQPTMSTYGTCATLSSGCLNYHVEHHDFPNVPWWKLPRIRRIAPKFYEHLSSSPGFFNSIWNFLVKPHDYVYACN